MKDKKFLVLCGLGVLWLVVFFATAAGIIKNPRLELLITFICVSWFAYWSISAVIEYIRSETPEKSTAYEPTKQANANPKKTSKSK